MTFSIIKKNQLEGAQRLDAEYYQPKYLDIQKKLFGYDNLSQYVNDIIHPKEIRREYQRGGVKFLVSQNIKDGFLDLSNLKYISEDTSKLLSINKISQGDLVTVRTGEIGNVANWSQSDSVIVSADCLIIKKPKISPDYLMVYLSSKPIKKLLKRQSYGIAQPHITPVQLKNIPVLIPSKNQIVTIERLAQDSREKLSESENYYGLAIQVLLKSLEIKKSDFLSQMYTIIKSLQTIKTNRLDAEYYCGPYSELANRLKKIKTSKLAEIVIYNKRGIQPHYVEDSDYYTLTSQFIKSKYIDYSSLLEIPEDDFDKNKLSQLKYGDVLVYTTGAYVGRTQAWMLRGKKAIASNHVNIIRVKKVDPLYLSIVMNSIIGQIQIKTMISGAAQAELYPKDIDKIIIPILPKSTQQKIADLVRKSHSARQKSKEVLEEAKRKVEEIIEKEKYDT